MKTLNRIIVIVGGGLLIGFLIAGIQFYGLLEFPAENACKGGKDLSYVEHQMKGGTNLFLILQNDSGHSITIDKLEFGEDFKGPTINSRIGTAEKDTRFIVSVIGSQYTKSSYKGTLAVTYTRDDGKTKREEFTCYGEID